MVRAEIPGRAASGGSGRAVHGAGLPDAAFGLVETVHAPAPGYWSRLARAHAARLGPDSRAARFHAPLPADAAAALAARTVPDIACLLWMGGLVRGMCVLHRLPDGHSAEMALSLEDPYQGHGWGRQLLEAGQAAARADGVAEIRMFIAQENAAMRALARRAGALPPRPGAADWMILLLDPGGPSRKTPLAAAA